MSTHRGPTRTGAMCIVVTQCGRYKTMCPPIAAQRAHENKGLARRRRACLKSRHREEEDNYPRNRPNSGSGPAGETTRAAHKESFGSARVFSFLLVCLRSAQGRTWWVGFQGWRAPQGPHSGRDAPQSPHPGSPRRWGSHRVPQGLPLLPFSFEGRNFWPGFGPDPGGNLFLVLILN